MPYNEANERGIMRFFAAGAISDFDEAINRVLAELKETDLDTEKYEARLAYLERLNKMRAEESSKRVSPDTKAVIVTNLLGILIIVGYERGHVLISKGLGFVLRTKHQ